MKKHSIQTKLMVMVGVFIAVTLLAVLGPVFYLIMNHEDERAEQQALKGAQGLKNMLDDKRQEALDTASVIAGSSGVIKAIEEKNAQAILQELNSFVVNKQVDFITVTDAQGTVLVRTHEAKAGDKVTNQANIKGALNGQPTGTIETGTVIKLSARAGVPVKNGQGQLIGVISTGYAAESFVDKAKELFGSEATLFLGDERIATTVERDGKRVVGTKAASQVVEKVLTKGEPFAGKADIVGKPYLTYYLPLLGPEGKPIGMAFAGQDIASVNAVKNKIAYTVLGVVVLVLAIAVLVSIRIARNMVAPIKQLTEAMDKVADGDFTQQVNVQSKDEIGRLAADFNLMLEQVRQLVLKVSGMIESLSAASQQLTANTDQSAEASKKVAESIDHVAQSAEQQFEAVEKISTVIGQLSAGIKQVAASVDSVVDSTNRTNSSAEAGQQAIGQAVQQMNQIEGSISLLEQIVEKLGKNSDQIGDIVNTIAAIAGQTNLLALNAAIEAARAGEHGRGFAVVAEEVRKLAEESETAAEKIALLIGDIQADTSKAVTAMHEGVSQVKNGTLVVSSSGKAFQEISQLVAEVSGQIREIAAVIQEMASGSEQIVQQVKNIDQLSRDTANETQVVYAATEEQLASMEEVAAGSKSLVNMADEVQTAVTRFKL